jgi:hypothetical protein
MQLNGVTRYIMLSCSTVLLAFTSVSVKPQTPCLQGTYTLDAAASDDVNKAIEDAVKEVNFFFRPIARSNLRKINVSPKQISISFIDTDVSIKNDQHPPVRTPVNGVPVDWKREGEEKVKVSTVWENGNLKRTFEAGAGQRINTYILSTDGKTLTLQVKVTSSHLPQPLTYKLVYKRAG